MRVVAHALHQGGFDTSLRMLASAEWGALPFYIGIYMYIRSIRQYGRYQRTHLAHQFPLQPSQKFIVIEEMPTLEDCWKTGFA